MKAFIFSDVHGRKRALEAVASLSDFKEADLVIFCGDLCDSCLSEVLASLGSDVLAVTGNMDDYLVKNALERTGVLIDSKLVTRGEFVIAGVGGLDHYASAKVIYEKLKRLYGENDEQ